LTVKTLQQRARRRQLQTVKGHDGLVRLRFSSGDANGLATLRSTDRLIVGQLTNPDNFGALERTTTLLREQLELAARLSEELVEERQRRRAAESTTADLQRQLAELEQDLSIAISGLASEGESTVRTAQEPYELAEMEERAKDWRRRSGRKSRSALGKLRRNMRRLLNPLAIR